VLTLGVGLGWGVVFLMVPSTLNCGEPTYDSTCPPQSHPMFDRFAIIVHSLRSTEAVSFFFPPFVGHPESKDPSSKVQ